MYDSSQVLQARRGRLLVAPFGTTRPSTLTEALTPNAAFRNVGFTGDDDVMFNRGVTIEAKKSWQASVPFTAIATDEEPTITIPSLLQWDGDNVVDAFGGGQIVPVAGGFSYVREPGVVAELSVLLAFKRQSFNYVLGLKRCVVAEQPDVKLTRKDLSPLPVKFAGLTPEDELDDAQDEPDPWLFFTDDPSFDVGS